jgi:energy-coupling factor transport system substrate-specific component
MTPPDGGAPAFGARVVGVPLRSALALGLVSAAGLAMFLWPLLLAPGEGDSHAQDAPLVFVVILPALLAVVLAELADGVIDTKAVAMLGVLSAVGAALRPVGAGVAGIETVFFLLVLAGRVYGPGFAFVLGNTTLFASALLTGGIGPWLPFQMLAAGWVGLGAGLLPRRGLGGRAELAVLAAYGALSAYVYGFLMNLWFWPFALGGDTELSFVAGAPVWENLHRFVLYTVATSSLGWDTGRAITNAAAILVLGSAVLYVLRRAARRAAFGAAVVVVPPPEPIHSAATGTTEGVETGDQTGRSSSCTSTVSP